MLSKDDEEDNRSGDVTFWVVSVDGSSEEEVISEKMLGRVLESQDQSDGSTFEKTVKEKPAKKTTKAKVNKTKKKKGINRIGTRANKGGEEELVLNRGVEIERRPPRKKPAED